MQPSISLVTLGTADMARARRFYDTGFGWTPVFEMPDIAFYQMNGFVFGLYANHAFLEDSQRPAFNGPGAFALAQNVAAKDDVVTVMDQLVAAGGKVLRPADEPPHGGFRGYVTDPDDHAWEIAWNPAWPIGEDGRVTFSL